MVGRSERRLSAEGAAALREGIELLLSQWTALQLAVENEWGGRDSRRKSDLLRSDIFSWFTQSREPLHIYDLEDILYDALEVSFNTECLDDSIEEVAEKLIIMHEDCLDRDFKSIVELRNASLQKINHSLVRQVNELEDSDSDDTEEDNSSDMSVDEPESRTNSNQVHTPVDEPKSNPSSIAEDGWVRVSSSRSKAKRH